AVFESHQVIFEAYPRHFGCIAYILALLPHDGDPGGQPQRGVSESLAIAIRIGHQIRLENTIIVGSRRGEADRVGDAFWQQIKAVIGYRGVVPEWITGRHEQTSSRPGPVTLEVVFTSFCGRVITPFVWCTRSAVVIRVAC